MSGKQCWSLFGNGWFKLIVALVAVVTAYETLRNQTNTNATAITELRTCMERIRHVELMLTKIATKLDVEVNLGG